MNLNLYCFQVPRLYIHTTLHVRVCNHQNLRINYLTAHKIMGVITHKCTVVDLSVRPAFLIDFQKIKNFDWKKKTFNGPKSIKNFKLNAFFLDEFQFTHIGQSKSNSRTNFNESCLFVTKKVFLRYIQKYCQEH